MTPKLIDIAMDDTINDVIAAILIKRSIINY